MLRWSGKACLLALLAGFTSGTAGCGDEGRTAELPDAALDTAGTGGDGAASFDPDADVGGDEATAPQATDGGADVSPTDDTGSADVAPALVCGGALKPAGCACTKNPDCESDFCIDTPKGQRCAQTCLKPCPADFKCAGVASGNDVVNICVPQYGNLCNPCTKNAECQLLGNGGGRCVTKGDAGAFCGLACVESPDCPKGYACQTVSDIAGQESKQCVIEVGGACGCTESAMKLQLSTKCFASAGEGKCQGVRTCLLPGVEGAPEGGGLTSCKAPEPVKEACNGKDDDCDGQTDEGTCVDGNPCTEDACLGASGCNNPNNGQPCDADNSQCTKNDVCLDGKCQPGKPVVCDDFNPCTSDACDAQKGCVYLNTDGIGCNADDTNCTIPDQCQGGKCEAGKKKACDLGEACVIGVCKVATGICDYQIKDGLACNDGNPCTAGEKCKGELCLGDATPCNDSLACTADSCDGKTGCVHAPIPGVCDDGDPCTAGDGCADGKCVGSSLKALEKCADSSECTEDLCVSKAGCVNKLLTGAKCDDGNPCTTNDACAAGQCAATVNNCGCNTDGDCSAKEDNDFCNGTLFCDKAKAPYQCNVNPATVKKCNDALNGPCQVVACDPGSGACKLIKKANGQGCDADGSACTSGDECQDGLCLTGSLQGCDDKNGCTADTCDPVKGCQYKPLTGACDADGSACTEGDTCQAAVCIVGKSKVCNDSEACTKDTCDPKNGQCTYAAAQLSCTDGDVCTAGDACGPDPKTGKHTCLPGSANFCDDSNPCTTDTCDPIKGCANLLQPGASVACYGGDPKTKGVGVCKDGKAACGVDSKPGACVGEVVPAQSDPCNGKDDDCNGSTDAGCGIVAFTARQAVADVSGAASVGGGTGSVRAVAGGSAAGGTAAAGSYTFGFGFLKYVKALFAN